MNLIFNAEPDPGRFQARVGPFLERDPIMHTSPITVLNGVISGQYDRWRLAAVESPAGEVVGCAVQTPPHKVMVATDRSEAASALARGLRELDIDLPGVVGVSPGVREFAASWCEGLPRAAVEVRSQRLFRLDTLVGPRPAAGSARPAAEHEIDLLVELFDAFKREVRMPAFSDPRRTIQTQVAEGRMWVWAVDDQVVSYLGRSPVLLGHARIGPVYTPPAHRGAGFASNLVAAASEDLLERGAVPTLFTDLANPTSNAIYRAIGYEPVVDAYEIDFVAT